MLKKIITYINYSQAHKVFIGSLPVDKTVWDKSDNEDLNNLKSTIRTQLETTHGSRCAYCGNDLYITSYPEIEHIAPKWKYPSLMFIEKNLCLACHYCNGFSKKGKRDTISVYNANYELCNFKLDEERQTEYRAKNYIYDQVKANFTGDMNELINLIINYKPNN